MGDLLTCFPHHHKRYGHDNDRGNLRRIHPPGHVTVPARSDHLCKGAKANWELTQMPPIHDTPKARASWSPFATVAYSRNERRG